ncbi:MAG: tyrosine-type recombinase/integrase [Phycisphaerales bacterium]
MATLTRESNGRFTVRVFGTDGKRRSVRLGKISQRQAESVKSKINDLEQAALVGDAPREENRRWAASLQGQLRDRLSAVGLVAPLPRQSLAEFIDGYIAKRRDVKPATATVYQRTRRHLVNFFKADRLISSITANDAQDWRRHLVDVKLADNTVRRTCGIARQFFHDAVATGAIESNPFAGLPSSVRRNSERMFYVTRTMAAAVLDACPDAEWRLIFALARFAGLRCPSELLHLKWADVDWANERFTVHSPKTEHHESGESRVVPTFPDLLPYLRESFELAVVGAVHVVPRATRPGVNINPQMHRIIKRSGVKLWPKLFINLRSSCESDLLHAHPFHAVCAWLGHGPEIAAKHYAQVTEIDFKKAVQNPGQNPGQHVQAERGTAKHERGSESSQVLETTKASTFVPACAEVCVNTFNGQGRT